jgi:hypothetical protein
MSTATSSSDTYIPPPPDNDGTSLIAILTAGKAQEKAELARLSKYVAKKDSARSSYIAKRKRIISNEKHAQLRKYMQKQDGKITDAIFPSGRLPSDKQIEALKADRNKAALTYLKRNRIDLAKMRQAVSESEKAMARIMKRPVPRYKGKPIQIMRADDVPATIRKRRTNPWTVMAPPFDGWAWNYYGWRDGFKFTPTLYLDHAGGFMGNRNYLYDSDAGDWDDAFIAYHTQVGFWYKMPKAGILEVWVEARPTEAQHYCSLYDEWGWSGSSVYQYNYITLQVNNGSLRQSRSSYWWESGYTDGYWNNRYLTINPPTSYWHHLYSMESYAKDAWVFVKIGSRSTNSTYANDVRTYSEIDFRWFARSVQLRVAP